MDTQSRRPPKILLAESGSTSGQMLRSRGQDAIKRGATMLSFVPYAQSSFLSPLALPLPCPLSPRPLP